jgi:hypothetical protein
VLVSVLLFTVEWSRYIDAVRECCCCCCCCCCRGVEGGDSIEVLFVVGSEWEDVLWMNESVWCVVSEV